ncbi:MAG: 30S ribosomal protein S4 [Bdellovibrio sp.]|nr:30S ribosomal protein S4 [Bdellovibrio sp.]
MMRKGKDPRFKLQRRLLTELPGLGKAGALERRPYPPGQHGARRIKYSDYRLQLEEKQKVRIHYNLREEQLIRLVKKAKKKKATKWISTLINILERRLENIIFRAGFAPSQAAAAQLISHGQVYVNNKKVTIRSAEVKKGDRISLSPKGLKNQIYTYIKSAPRLPNPDWLEKTDSDEQAFVILKDDPNLETIPFAFDDSLVTSYYSKV